MSCTRWRSRSPSPPCRPASPPSSARRRRCVSRRWCATAWPGRRWCGSRHLSTTSRKAAKKRHRPLVHDGDAVELLTRQLAAREPLVLALDPLVVDVSTTDDEAAAELIIEFARDAPAGT